MFEPSTLQSTLAKTAEFSSVAAERPVGTFFKGLGKDLGKASQQAAGTVLNALQEIFSALFGATETGTGLIGE